MRCWKCKQPDVMLSPIVVKGRRRHLCGDCVHDSDEGNALAGDQTERETMTPDNDGWEDVQGGLGEKIDWADDRNFTGTYLGPITAQDKEGTDLEAFAFRHEGVEYFAWSSYQLTEALKQVPVGNLVQISYLGKREMANGQSVNLFKVRHKADSEPVSVTASQPQLGDEESF